MSITEWLKTDEGKAAVSQLTQRLFELRASHERLVRDVCASLAADEQHEQAQWYRHPATWQELIR